MASKHEMTIEFLIEQRDYWRGRIENHEDKITSYKDEVIRLREERDHIAERLRQFDASIALLKSAQFNS